MPWYALYTKPRNEKKLSNLLKEKGIEVYCPVQETIKQWSDRKKKIIEPVFRSYIFVFLNDYSSGNVEVLNTPGAVRFLWWLGKPGTVRQEEIDAIRDFLNSYKNVKFNFDLKAGEHVTITEGPLKEQTGKLLSIRGRKAILQLMTLGMSLIAEIPAKSLSKTME
jgi:transcriptional antiterminator RfaH